jgi:putative oxidoreductase
MMRGDDLAKFLLRVTLGVLMLFHGVGKIGARADYAPGLVAKVGLPSELGYLVYVGEVVAPILLILGIWTRPAALLVVINMVVAFLLVLSKRFFALGNFGGWALELEGMFFMTALVVALLGAGRFSLGGASGRWN